MSKQDRDEKEASGWLDFCQNALQEFDGKSNLRTNFDFGKLTKRFGKYYLWYLAAAYQAKDVMSDDEFCAINGLVPSGFLKKVREMKL